VLTLSNAADVEIDSLPQIIDRQIGCDELQRIDVDDIPVLKIILSERSPLPALSSDFLLGALP